MENWGSCYYTRRDKASSKSLAALGSYTSFSAVTSILACFFVPPPPFLLIVTRGLPSRKGEPETVRVEAWEGRKEQLILPDWKDTEGYRGAKGRYVAGSGVAQGREGHRLQAVKEEHWIN